MMLFRIFLLQQARNAAYASTMAFLIFTWSTNAFHSKISIPSSYGSSFPKSHCFHKVLLSNTRHVGLYESLPHHTSSISETVHEPMSLSSLSCSADSTSSISSNSKTKRPKMKRPKRISQIDSTKNQKNAVDTTSTVSSGTKKTKGVISEEELANHVSSMYIHGPGGIFNNMVKKRERREKIRNNGDDSHHGANQVLDQEYEEFLRKLDRHPALVLNADYQPLSVLPLSIWPWQETIKALFSGKVSVVDVYPELTVRAVNMDVPLPSVIALTDYVKQPNQVPAFTRRNVFLRDGYKCQYCAKSFMTRDLSLDHVNPRCNGGRLEWTNTVTSCLKCNGKKGSTPPHELKYIGMKLMREPHVPSKWELAANAEKMVPKKVHPTWRPFLGMNMMPEGGDKNNYYAGGNGGGDVEVFFHDEDFEY